MADEEHLPGCSALFSTIDGGPFNDSACDCWGERMAVFRAQLERAQENIKTLLANHQNVRAQLEQAQTDLASKDYHFMNSVLRERMSKLCDENDTLKATIARQREWIEKAGHRRKCSVRAPHAATMDYKPTCDCGYSELTEN